MKRIWSSWRLKELFEEEKKEKKKRKKWTLYVVIGAIDGRAIDQLESLSLELFVFPHLLFPFRWIFSVWSSFGTVLDIVFTFLFGVSRILLACSMKTKNRKICLKFKRADASHSGSFVFRNIFCILWDILLHALTGGDLNARGGNRSAIIGEIISRKRPTLFHRERLVLAPGNKKSRWISWSALIRCDTDHGGGKGLERVSLDTGFENLRFSRY